MAEIREGEAQNPRIKYGKGFEWLDRFNVEKMRTDLDRAAPIEGINREVSEKTVKDLEYAKSELEKGNPEPLRIIILSDIEGFVKSIKERRVEGPLGLDLEPKDCIQRADWIKGYLEVLQQLDS